MRDTLDNCACVTVKRHEQAVTHAHASTLGPCPPQRSSEEGPSAAHGGEPSAEEGDVKTRWNTTPSLRRMPKSKACLASKRRNARQTQALTAFAVLARPLIGTTSSSPSATPYAAEPGWPTYPCRCVLDNSRTRPCCADGWGYAAGWRCQPSASAPAPPAPSWRLGT